MAYGQVRHILESMPHPDARISHIHGVFQDGWTQAVKNGTRGLNGGMIGVIDAIAEGMKKQAARRYVEAVFLDCLDPLDFDTKVAFMQEYLELYGAVVLPDEELMSSYQLAANLESVVQNHVNLINQFRTTLR